jgi:NADH:ubiquinone oxidoreductase subunit 6 (subunit J)
MIQLEFYFLGLTYLIVYIGAICILFLFVIMMLETHPFKYSSYFTLDDLIVSLLLLVLVFSLMYLVYPYFNLTNLSVNLYHFYLPNWSLDFITFTDLSSIGLALYIAFPLILIILSLIFWVVLIGVLSLHS